MGRQRRVLVVRVKDKGKVGKQRKIVKHTLYKDGFGV